MYITKLIDILAVRFWKSAKPSGCDVIKTTLSYRVLFSQPANKRWNQTASELCLSELMEAFRSEIRCDSFNTWDLKFKISRRFQTKDNRQEYCRVCQLPLSSIYFMALIMELGVCLVIQCLFFIIKFVQTRLPSSGKEICHIFGKCVS